LTVYLSKGISMSSHHIHNHNQPLFSERTQGSSGHNDNQIHQARKLFSIVRGAMLLGSTSLLLAGCQSSPAGSSSAAVSNNMLDFNIANPVESQAQGRAFNASLATKSAHYDQLFNQEKYPNTENQAKSHLLAAIRQHLATEHVAVAQANYQSVPFIHPDSIDAGASGLLRTIIETYAYESGPDDENDSYDEDYDDVAEATETDDTSEYDAAESDAIAAVLEEAGENNEPMYSDDEDYDDEEGTETNSVLSGMSGLNPRGLAKKYEAMQMAKQQPKTVNENDKPVPSTEAVGQMLTMFHRTPEQIAATNAYQYKHLTFSSVSHYKPKKRQLQSVYSYDYVTPTIGSSIQIPLAFDFTNSRVTVDPSAILPIVAIVNPENTPLPNQMASHTVSFGLPESITAQLPPAVLYDAAVAAIQSSMAELAPEHFSAVDIRQDQFAKEVGASRAVKVYFGSQQSGEMIGKILKYMTQSLQNHVDTNPDKYPDGAMLKAALDKMALYNKGYQSADVGALLQLIEAIGPLSFNQINYYYLDSSDRLLAKQQRMNIGGDLLGSTTTILNQIRYDKASFNKHVLTPLLAESFGENAKPAIDGNAWIAEQRLKKDRLQTARYARYDYSDSDVNDDGRGSDDDSTSYNDVDYVIDAEEDTDNR
jgi:hypothetical protein